MDDVTLTESADLRLDSLFLLQKHTTGFQVADFGDHGALHDGAAFVVLDIAHPPRLVERDFFCEALLFKVTYSVVIGVCEEVLDLRSGFDVVFEVGHEVRAVAFDLLVGRDGAEDNLSELPAVEGAVGDSSVVRLASIL